MEAGMWVNIAVAIGSLIFTLVCCTAAVIIFLWKRFDTVSESFNAVYDQIEEIKIHQGTKFVKHDVCAIRTNEVKTSINKDIENAILKHEAKEHGKS